MHCHRTKPQRELINSHKGSVRQPGRDEANFGDTGACADADSPFSAIMDTANFVQSVGIGVRNCALSALSRLEPYRGTGRVATGLDQWVKYLSAVSFNTGAAGTPSNYYLFILQVPTQCSINKQWTLVTYVHQIYITYVGIHVGKL